MTPRVIDVHECGSAVTRAHGFVSKLVGSIEVMGELISRRNQCA